MAETLTPLQKGRLLCERLNNLHSTFPILQIVRPELGATSIPLQDEFGVTKEWDKFVQFPKDLGELFPGSYISPELFFEKLGKTEEIKEAKKQILGWETAHSEEPIFAFSRDGFNVRVMNGMFNPHALDMSRLAKEVSDKKEYPLGFADPKAAPIRAQYQNAMKKNISHELARKPLGEKRPAIRIHDDCLASGDSIISYLYDQIQDAGVLQNLQERGVSIVIDGAATAQGILYLKAFAKAFNIPIELTAGHMAFGLSAGERASESGPLQHANYLEYPPQSEREFYEDVDAESQREIFSLGTEKVAVHGDMGEAEKGISSQDMEAIRKPFEREEIYNYCEWNDFRQDDHGDHPMSKKGITLKHVEGSNVTDYVYFARGGYLPYAFDLMNVLSEKSKEKELANVVIIRLSRLNAKNMSTSEELGYGAAFAKAECVKHVN